VKKVIEVEFDGADEPLTVTYDRDALIRAIANGAPIALLADRLSHVRMDATVNALVESIVSWNLVGNDSRPIAIDRETFNELPIFVISKIGSAIWADAFPAAD